MAGRVGEVVEFDRVANFEFVEARSGVASNEIGGVGHDKRAGTLGRFDDDLFGGQVEVVDFAGSKGINVADIFGQCRAEKPQTGKQNNWQSRRFHERFAAEAEASAAAASVAAWIAACRGLGRNLMTFGFNPDGGGALATVAGPTAGRGVVEGAGGFIAFGLNPSGGVLAAVAGTTAGRGVVGSTGTFGAFSQDSSGGAAVVAGATAGRGAVEGADGFIAFGLNPGGGVLAVVAGTTAGRGTVEGAGAFVAFGLYPSGGAALAAVAGRATADRGTVVRVGSFRSIAVPVVASISNTKVTLPI